MWDSNMIVYRPSATESVRTSHLKLYIIIHNYTTCVCMYIIYIYIYIYTYTCMYMYRYVYMYG